MNLVAGRGDAAAGAVGELADLVGLDQRHDRAGRAGPGGAAGAVQVVLVVVRRVEVHDQLDVVDVDAARSDVGRDQDPRMPGREGVEGALPLALVAGRRGWRRRRRPARSSCLASRSAPCLVRTKKQRAAGRPAISAATATLSCGVSTKHVVVHRSATLPAAVDRVQRRSLQVAAHELVDAAVEGGGEEQALAAGRGRVEDAR